MYLKQYNCFIIIHHLLYFILKSNPPGNLNSLNCIDYNKPAELSLRSHMYVLTLINNLINK